MKGQKKKVRDVLCLSVFLVMAGIAVGLWPIDRIHR